ncbi:hypothetical protein CEQ90_14390 [Lewinellaceae bacterium SD302]|nr:hypothetical protein CEQ90_14390 [Lewinellaceae bacterium SD302]
MKTSIFFPANAHEGCVWVAAQQRLYFTTLPDLDNNRVALRHLDFAGQELRSEENWSELINIDPTTVSVETFLGNINMANSFCLSADGGHFLVCEQGAERQLSVLSRIDIFTKKREVLIDNYLDQPFNSLNKVIVSRLGHLIFTDPDYGFRQGFRPPPELEPALYVRPTGQDEIFQANEEYFEMPHGIVLSSDERSLFVTDTSSDGQHDDEVDLDRCQDVYRLPFDPQNGIIKGKPKHCFRVDQGVPDGMVFVNNHLLVCAGDGIYIGDENGEFLRKIEMNKSPVNLDAVGPQGEHLFVTVDDGVVFLPDWIETGLDREMTLN